MRYYNKISDIAREVWRRSWKQAMVTGGKQRRYGAGPQDGQGRRQRQAVYVGNIGRPLRQAT